ncbi:MAG: hypothetical protein KAS32_05760 [Candidatus Peribacteraceae bacterium]|nr:hypothetical protein [Candidatus Peribacteraceae bacterium]
MKEEMDKTKLLDGTKRVDFYVIGSVGECMDSFDKAKGMFFEALCNLFPHLYKPTYLMGNDKWFYKSNPSAESYKFIIYEDWTTEERQSLIDIMEKSGLTFDFKWGFALLA